MDNALFNFYENVIYKCINKEEIKQIVKILYNDDRIDDDDFSDFIYEVVIPRLENDFKCNLELNNNTNYENVMMENY